jgi:serine/threonine-protein kinase
MVDPQTSRFWLAALQSGLLDAAGLTACWEGIPPEKRDAVEHLDRRLARQSVLQSRLTLWQAQQLLAGRTTGFRVDRYLLLDMIGHGGMGRVYLARDTRLDREVALKILAPERMNNPRAIARFQREARVGAQLQHENLVRIYDFGESNGRYYLVMEYIEGKTIGALISSQGPVPYPTAVRLTRQIALGLEHAHRKGLIHRDVNPYNILVTHEGVAKLADLGLAIDLADDDRVTREGATVGTFDYVAPEQARHSHAADIRSDIYSLGCTLYHMVAGQVPFPSPSLPEKLFAHQALEPTPLDQIIPEVPPGLVQVVQRMMRKSPEERYGTPVQLAHALEPFLDDYASGHESGSDTELLIADESGTVPAGPPAASPESRAAPGPIVSEPKAPLANGTGATVPAYGNREPVPAAATAVQQAASGPGPNAGPPATVGPSFLTPIPAQDNAEVTSAEEIPLYVDLGPEPSLSESLIRPRAWFGGERTGLSTGTMSEVAPSPSFPATGLLSKLEGWRRQPWFRWGAAATVLALLTLVYTLSRLLVGGDQPPHPLANERRDDDLGQGAGAKGVVAKSDAPIIVRGEDGQETPYPTLAEAVSHALGSKGTVVLQNQEPLSIEENLPISVSGSGRSWLSIRGAEGLYPILQLDLKKRKPLLQISQGVNVTIEDLTIVARYPEASTGVSPLPLIDSAGSLNLIHCLFQAEPGSRGVPVDSRVVVSRGGNLSVENCMLEGFDTALDIQASAGASLQVADSILASSRTPKTPPVAMNQPGWAMRVEFQGSGNRGGMRRLILDHCTAVGTGLIQLSAFSAELPIAIDARACAVQTETLMGWSAARADLPPDGRAVQWSGASNQYDVSGPWVVFAGRMLPAASPAVRNLTEWKQIAQERESISGSIDFVTRPEARQALPRREDFTIKSAGSARRGADPKQVGPRTPRPPRPLS